MDPNPAVLGAGAEADRTRLTPMVRLALVEAISAGNRLSIAATTAGVSPKTVSEWLRRGRGSAGRPSSELYVAFAEEVDHAFAVAEVRAMAVVWKGMRRNPRYAIWSIGV